MFFLSFSEYLYVMKPPEFSRILKYFKRHFNSFFNILEKNSFSNKKAARTIPNRFLTYIFKESSGSMLKG